MIRFDNLIALAKARQWTPKELSSLTGKNRNLCSDLLNRKKPSFGEKLARAIEEKLGLPKLWLDAHHDDAEFHNEDLVPLEPPKAMQEQAEYTVTAGFAPFNATQVADRNVSYAPLIEWGEMGEKLLLANTEWPRECWIAFPPTQAIHGEKCKVFKVADNNLAPRIQAGDLLAVDPENLSPRMGQVVLASGVDGTLLLKRFNPLPQGEFDLVDANGVQLNSRRHGLKLLGVIIGMIPHDF